MTHLSDARVSTLNPYTRLFRITAIKAWGADMWKLPNDIVSRIPQSKYYLVIPLKVQSKELVRLFVFGNLGWMLVDFTVCK